MDNETIIEAVLFASGDPVALEKLAEIIEQDKKDHQRDSGQYAV
jgi:chromosome segregation and condensation protein ScpB